MSETNTLRLLAVDPEDLKVISAACQDGVCKPADLTYEAKKRRFTIEFNRYRWEAPKGLPAKSADLVLSLMSVEWTPDAEPPSGAYRLIFAGDGELLVSVDCLDATLVDVSAPWPTRNRPTHKE